MFPLSNLSVLDPSYLCASIWLAWNYTDTVYQSIHLFIISCREPFRFIAVEMHFCACFFLVVG